MSSCTLCSDNFIVNTKCIQCKYCQAQYHSHCVKIRDPIQKVITESPNLLWFCDSCLPIVMDKLSSGIVGVGTAQRVMAASSPGDGHLGITPADLGSIRDIITEALTAGVSDIKRHYDTASQNILHQSNDMRNEVLMLKESNIQLVHMLAPSCGLLDPLLAGIPSASGNQPINALSCSDEDGDGVLGLGQALHSGNRSNEADSNAIGANVAPLRKDNLSRKRYRKSPRNGSEAQSASGGIRQSLSAAKPFLRGCGQANDLLKPAPKGRNWIWVGGLSRDTSEKNISEYLGERIPGKDILVFDLKSKSSRKSFKVGSNELTVEELMSPSIWPSGILLKPFRFKQRQ